MSKEYETVIGLEVHVQLATVSKIFCSCSTRFESAPNTNICPVCCGYPGALPVFNRRALELAIRVACALNCRINERIYFERKNYFYPDLPKNYQISQYKLPLGEDGYLALSTGKDIGIERVHLEEDAGKLLHREGYSLVDFNRTGTPLLEIVSKPDINSPGEAFEYLHLLKLTIQYIGASSCDMEKGYLRCDANISVRPKGEKELGTKVELKNMNSFKGVRDALSFEAKRQIKALKEEKAITQETRLWNEAKGATGVMRTKEEAHDYRYFPEPDLVDFIIDAAMVRKEREQLGELPLARRKRFLKEFPLSENEIDIIISFPALAHFFEAALKGFNDAKNIANWLLGPFLEMVNARGGGMDEVKISPQNFARIVKYFVEGKLNNLAAKKVLSLSLATDKDIDTIITEENLVQVSAEDELTQYIEVAISENPQAVEDVHSGAQKALMFLVGQVMKKTKGKANPKVVRELFERRLQK